MTEQSPAQAHAAAVRRHIASLPRWGYGDRQRVIALVTEQGDIYARVERATERLHANDLIKQAQAERDTARRELEQAGDKLRKAIEQRAAAEDEAGTLREQLAEGLAERNLLRKERDMFEGEADRLARSALPVQAERDRLRETLAAMTRPGPEIPLPVTDLPAAPKLTQLPDGCCCTWTLMLPEGEFRRDGLNLACTADHPAADAAPHVNLTTAVTDPPVPAPGGDAAAGPRPRRARKTAGGNS